jgi:D-alanyl-D-alanine carboxypeptidase/D-alanyl-D-alanine-endopeptidase (penicillin-binding protein 4)
MWPEGIRMKIHQYRTHVLILISCLMLLASCTTRIHRSLESLTESPDLRGAEAGIVIKSLTDGAYLVKLNDERFFVPASNMKLFTTAAALVLLGPEFRYTTNLYADGEIRDGLLNGNLVIRGVGDPTLSGRFHPGGADEIFSGWVEALRRLGVKEIRGNIVGDGSLFGEESLGTGWAWDDDMHCYSAEISALSINDNCIAFSVRPGATAGEKPLISLDDASGYVTIRSQAVTALPEEEQGLQLSRLPGSNLLTAEAEQFFVTIHNPALFAAAHLKQVLKSKGIVVAGAVTDQQSFSGPVSYESMNVLASYNSPPLREIITQINKASRNLYAELLFRTLGKSFRNDGSATAAAEVVQATLAKMAIPHGSVVMYDGSGLSRMNLVMPSALVALLEHMYRHENFSYFLASLPVAGVDGTLKERMNNSPAEGNVKAKTGSMTHVLNLSGYVRGREGGMYAFSILINNYTGPSEAVKRLQDALLVRLVNLLD